MFSWICNNAFQKPAFLKTRQKIKQDSSSNLHMRGNGCVMISRNEKSFASLKEEDKYQFTLVRMCNKIPVYLLRQSVLIVTCEAFEGKTLDSCNGHENVATYRIMSVASEQNFADFISTLTICCGFLLIFPLNILAIAGLLWMLNSVGKFCKCIRDTILFNPMCGKK